VRRRAGPGLALAFVACSHVESLSNAYSPFSRDLGTPAGVGEPATGGKRLAVPIAELVSQPASYHRRQVRTEGYVTLQFEGNKLCPVATPADWKACLWLDIEGLADPGFRKGRAVVEGTFDGENLGHLGLVSGAIEKITSLTRLQ